MSRKLVIDGNAVYEIDEECMLRKRLDQEDETEKLSSGRQQDPDRYTHRAESSGYNDKGRRD